MKKIFSIMFSLALVFALLPATVFADDYHYKHNNRSCVTLYEHINYQGRHITFCSDDRNLVNNKDKHLQFGKKNWNDVASSAKVSRYGKGVVLWEHVNYEGAHWRLKPGHNYPDFTKHNLRHNQGSWNDIVSSVNIK